MNRLILLLTAMIMAVWAISPSLAQGIEASNSDEPIEITANETLEWHRNDKKFIARTNAQAKQGNVSIKATTLTADYRDGNGTGLEIYKMKAQDNVVVSSNENNAYGDEATYDVDQGMAVMTGKNLKMTAPDQTVTARDTFEYWVTEGRIIAKGDAEIIRPKPTGGADTLKSDKISALLKENNQGERVLHSMEAIGNVVITTPTEIVTGAYGIYRADSNEAEITGNVVIKRGPNILEGEKAIVDLTTNTSQIFGSEKTGGQVRGVFYPSSGKKEGK